MVEVTCSNCGKKFSRKRKYCDNCGHQFPEVSVLESKTDKDSEREKTSEIKPVVISKEEWEEHRETSKADQPPVKQDKRNLYCTSCGKLHESESKFCQYCGYDLESAILRFKGKRLPIKFDQSLPPEEKDKELEGMEFYKQVIKKEPPIDDAEYTGKIRKIPRKSTRNILVAVVILIGMAVVATFIVGDRTDLFGTEAEGA